MSNPFSDKKKTVVYKPRPYYRDYDKVSARWYFVALVVCGIVVVLKLAHVI